MTPCVEHNQKGTKRGYGMKKVGDKTMLIHRWAFMQKHGYLPEVVMHLCDNPRCYNVDHLQAGTQQQNLELAWQTGRKERTCGTPRKLTDDEVRAIRASTETQQVVAARYGVTQNAVSCIKLGKTYRGVQ